MLVETDPDPRLWWRGTVRVPTVDGPGTPVPWACAGADALTAAARPGGWWPAAVHAGARSFVELRRW